MLLRFGVANHRSIRDYQELLLTASRPEDGRLTMPVPVVEASAVPVAALYGANASGKSNLLDAMDDLRLLVSDSHKGHDATDPIRRFPFRLNATSAGKPTRFECSFTVESGAGDASAEAPVYDLEVEFTDSEICRERLRRSVRHERRSTHTLYARETRNGNVAVEFGAHLEGENQVTAKLTRPNSLFLSAAAQNNHPQLTDVHRWFSRDWCCLLSGGLVAEHVAAEVIAGSGRRDWLDSLLKQAEAGVGGIELGERELDPDAIEFARDLAAFVAQHADEEAPDPRMLAHEFVDAKRRRLRLLHETATGLLPLDYESESRGTKMFLTLVLPALEALSSGSLLVIDELDSSLHPQLAQAFVSLFLRSESNPHGAQLVFSTHDVALLGAGFLAQDEIWMVDKSSEGATSLTPLSDFRLRGDVERAYRNGRVGGTPDLHGFFLDLVRQS